MCFSRASSARRRRLMIAAQAFYSSLRMKYLFDYCNSMIFSFHGLNAGRRQAIGAAGNP